MEPNYTSTGEYRTEPRGYPLLVKHKDRYGLHIILFLLTLGSTMFMGGRIVERIGLYEVWQPDQPVWLLFTDPVFLLDGFLFGGSLLLFLTFHEFGHYFAARFHRIKTSLPYYIPTFILGFGTLGAVIPHQGADPKH